ncbi:MAG TPA: hypothetical protein VIM51_02360 [Desulfosporosinus sp.]
MINHQISTPNYFERLISMLRRNKPLEIKVSVMKVAHTDLTQTKEYWSTLAVLS